jgi:hypothetical protein
MRDQIKLRKKSGVEMTFTKETQAEKRSGKKLNSILGETSRNMLLMGILIAIGMLIN